MKILDDDYEMVRHFRNSKKKEDIELKEQLSTNRKKYNHLIMVTPNK